MQEDERDENTIMFLSGRKQIPITDTEFSRALLQDLNSENSGVLITNTKEKFFGYYSNVTRKKEEQRGAGGNMESIHQSQI